MYLWLYMYIYIYIYIKAQIFLFFSEALSMCDINKASDNKRNTCAFNKLYVYVSFNPYIYIYKQYCKYELVLTQAECSTW